MSSIIRYYCNTQFDLEMGAYPLEKIEKAAAEMTTLFVPMLRSGDRIILDVGIPDDYIPYVQNHFGCGRMECRDSSSATSCTDIVWGWNAAAAKRLSIDLSACRFAPESIALVNNRGFCYTCGLPYGSGVPGSHFCTTIDTIEDALQHLSYSYPLVVKPAYGGSGYGLFVLDNREAVEAKRPTMEYYCQHGGCTIEPWLERIADISSCVQIDDEGIVSSPLFHRQCINRFGAFYGIYILDDDPIIRRWRDCIHRITLLYAQDVAAAGYRGPLGVDSFIYRDRHGDERCAAGIEINGRYTMGLLAHQLRKKSVPDKQVLFRTLSRKRCTLPAAYDQLAVLLGKNRFDRERGEGIMVLSPLVACYRGTWSQPDRSVFLIAGSSEEQVIGFDDALRLAVAPERKRLTGFG